MSWEKGGAALIVQRAKMRRKLARSPFWDGSQRQANTKASGLISVMVQGLADWVDYAT
ncbi:hypothetical protein [Celeribacter sp.]|uniref:hypothetical protein n=1 Tax=Celeribacter sp. TaxID=1890673 RepID=UPI003A8D314E